MSLSAISALGAPASSPASISGSSGTAQTQHKHAAHSLKGSFAIAASHGLGAIGSAAIGASSPVSTSKNVLAALNNLTSAT